VKTVKPVIPECHVDTALIETLVRPQLRYSHQAGVDGVVNAMKRNYQGRFALGIIDKDKKRTTYLEEFELKKQVVGHLELWKHRTVHHFLILICPAAEDWILNRVKESSIKLEQHSLPSTLTELRRVTKSIVSQKDQNLIGLFNELKKSNNPVVDTLIDWVTQLKKDQFNVDLTALK